MERRPGRSNTGTSFTSCRRITVASLRTISASGCRPGRRRLPIHRKRTLQCCANSSIDLGLERFTLVVHDFGGPIGLPLALEPHSRVTRVIMMNTWAWPIDDDPRMARGARLIGGVIGRVLYRHANASLKLIMPSGYGDKKKLTRAIHAQDPNVFRDPDARVLVLHALAKSLLGSRAHYQALLDRIGELRKDPGADHLGTQGHRLSTLSARALAVVAAGGARRHHRRRRSLAARRGACAGRRRDCSRDE